MDRIRPLLVALVALTVLTPLACGETEELEFKTVEPAPDPTTPFSYDRGTRGVGYFPGDAELLAPRASELTGDVSTIVLRSQLLDELTVSRGGTVSESRFDAHVQTLADEVSMLGGFDETVVVLDLMRLSDGQATGALEPYLVSWDGNDRPEDRYGFWREDYRQHVLDQVRAVAETQQPATMVIGAEMERYLSMAGGDTDYANFVTLYREAYDVVKAVSPSTRVGAGIDWVRFQLDIVPNETLTGEEIPSAVDVDRATTQIPCDSVTGTDEEARLVRRACTQKAFERYIEPLLRNLEPNQPTAADGAVVEAAYRSTADVLALAAIGRQGDFGNDPSTIDDDFFGALRSWSVDYPVVWYEVNWRISGAVGADTQDRWLQTLLGAQTGVSVDLVAWAAVKDLLMSECGKLTNDLFAPQTVCFQGLWSDSLAPKAVFDTFVTDIAGQ